MPERHLLKHLDDGKDRWLGYCGLTDRLRSARRFSTSEEATFLGDKWNKEKGGAFAVYAVRESMATEKALQNPQQRVAGKYL